jgi:hypothetical protein
MGPSNPSPVIGPAQEAEPSLSKLTALQYEETIRRVIGDGALFGVERLSDVRVNGFFSVGARKLTVAKAGVRQFVTNAGKIAEWAANSADFKKRYGLCTPANATDAVCLKAVMRKIANELTREQVDEVTHDAFAAVAVEAATSEKDFWQGIRYGLEGLLMSPSFTHRVEIGRPALNDPDRVAFTATEMASRLSYFLWGGPPDEALLEAARNGSLETPEGYQLQLDRLLGHERFLEGVGQFGDDLLLLDGLNDLKRDASLKPTVDAETFLEMRKSAVMTFQDSVVRNKLSLPDVFRRPSTFVGKKLAGFYGLSPRNEMTLENFPSNSRRAGLLTEPGLLAVLAHEKTTSPTHRGKFIFTRLWCGVIPAPPADVDTSVDMANTTGTKREQTAHYLTNPRCLGCHSQMDPLGYGLEHFNPIGAEQVTDNGKPVDASGEIDGKRFNGAKDLSEIVFNDDRFMQCLSRQVFRHAYGLDVTGEDEGVATIVTTSARNGNTLQAVFRAIAMSEGFRVGKAPSP